MSFPTPAYVGQPHSIWTWNGVGWARTNAGYYGQSLVVLVPLLDYVEIPAELPDDGNLFSVNSTAFGLLNYV